MKHGKLSVSFLLFFVIFINHQISFGYSSPVIVESRLFYFEKFWRTELYFGMDKPDGSKVSDEEWNRFLSEVVTPKFPDGFTVLEAFGQFRDASGKIVKEKSHCLILLYSKKARKETDRKVEEIRTAYKKAFDQESVLRVDFRQTVNALF